MTKFEGRMNKGEEISAPLSPLGRAEPRIQLGLNATPALISDFNDRN
jgi:hypothetical protein